MKKKIKRYVVGISSVFFLVSLYLLYSQNVRFRFVDETTGIPIANTEFGIYQCVHNLKCSQESEFFIKSIKTDSEGFANCNMMFINHDDLFFINKNEDYHRTRITRSSDLRSTNSLWHIRIVRFEPGKTMVTGNDIYNLITGRVTFIPIYAESETKLYDYIELCIKRPNKKKSTGPCYNITH